VTGAGDERVATVAITLHGVTRDLRIPLRMLASADEIDVSGAVTLRQTDFGIVPLSVLGGAIQVEDAIDLRFRILAKRTK
jgi:polyisoprenoid-binding protein YceI